MKEVVAALTAELRRSPHVNQRSGVSVRYSIGNLETLAAAAVRRAARAGEPEAVPRVCDLPAVLEAALGRVEFDTVEEGREEEIVTRALRRRAPGVPPAAVRVRLPAGAVAVRAGARGGDLRHHAGVAVFLEQFGELTGLSKLLGRLGVEEESPGVAASALEFALEGLHLSRRLNKDAAGRAGSSRYRSAEPARATWRDP